MNKYLLRLFFAVAVGALIYLARDLPFEEWLSALEQGAARYPVAGPMAYVFATIVVVAFLTPGWIMMMLAGLVFGAALGFLYAMVGIVGGAVAAFLISRVLARQWVARKISGNVGLLALDDALEDQAFTIVALTRVALVFPFNILNYAYGVTRVKTRDYIAGTAIGMIPIVGFYVYLGTLADDIGQILTDGADVGSGALWGVAIALVAIISVVLVVRRALNRALQRRQRELVEEGIR